MTGVQFEVGFPSGSFPHSFHIDKRTGCAGGFPCVDNSSWSTVITQELLAFPLQEGYLNQAVEAYACNAPADLLSPLTYVTLYKEHPKLSPLGADDAPSASWGEHVNGLFAPPMPGVLSIEAEIRPYLEVYAATRPGERGWLTATGQDGVSVTPPPFILIASEGAANSVKFSARVKRFKSSDSVDITFRNYWYDSGSCCFQEDRVVQTLAIEPLNLVLDPRNPVLPDMKTRPTGDIEIRLPACGEAGANKTDWFLIWPTPNGQRIREGHAFDWLIDGSKLISPEPDPRIYPFGANP